MATIDTSSQQTQRNGSTISNDKTTGTASMPMSQNTQTKSASTELAKHAKSTVSHVAEQAAELVETQISQQKKRSVGELGNVAKALRGTRDELGESFAAPVVERAADEIERATKFLESASLNDIVDGAEDFARREPLLFLGGAFAVGMLAARFLKSSSRHNHGSPSAMQSGQQMRPQIPRPRNYSAQGRVP